ncbi:MAG TPA: hypothetical protein VFW34_04065 [Candidatus Rubrimentiphilum sp.]|nr:hypothetical protein [Candidatus Rubrimentiphilum sp.]
MKRTLLFFAFAFGVALFTVTTTHAQTVPASPSPAPSVEASPPPADNSPPPLPPPKPAPEDPKIRKIALQQFVAWQGGALDRSRYSDDVNAQLSDDVLDASEKALAALGALQSATFDGISQAKGIHVYVYTMKCEHGTIDMKFALQPDGKIALVFFT